MKKHQSGRTALIPVGRIERTIVRLRGHNVMLDADLADLYGVTTKRFNEQVRRNVRRFPGDFMFQLTREEYANLRSQIATSSSAAHGGRRHLPFAFTEHGAIMAASVLNARLVLADARRYLTAANLPAPTCATASAPRRSPICCRHIA